MTTIYMLLAKAREPIDDRKRVPAPLPPETQRTRQDLTKPGHLQLLAMRRRRTDSLSEHVPLVQRIWQSIKALATRDRAGANG
jgi:hypothetical protein